MNSGDACKIKIEQLSQDTSEYGSAVKKIKKEDIDETEEKHVALDGSSSMGNLLHPKNEIKVTGFVEGNCLMDVKHVANINTEIKIEDVKDVGSSEDEGQSSLKRPKRHFLAKEKESIYSIFNTSMEKYPKLNKTKIVEITANLTGVSVTSVYEIIKEYNIVQRFPGPKLYTRKKGVLDTIDDDAKNAIRKLIHKYFFRREVPTFVKIWKAITDDPILPEIKQSSLRALLQDINFRFNRRHGNSFLKETDRIITWRRDYLRQMEKYRQEGRKIYYLDETCINTGYRVVFEQVGKKKRPIHKNRNFTINHIGSDNGFVEDAWLLHESLEDSGEETNCGIFEEWFQGVLPKLETGSVIVLDAAPHHCRRTKRIPTSNWYKKDIIAWLVENGISYESDMVRVELLYLVKQNQPGKIQYVIDELAEANDKTVLRIPPYHCELNPMEAIWGKIRAEIEQEIADFEFVDAKIEQLLLEALQTVSADDWNNAIKSVLLLEKDMWLLDDIIEVEVEPLLSQFEDYSSEDSDVNI